MDMFKVINCNYISIKYKLIRITKTVLRINYFGYYLSLIKIVIKYILRRGYRLSVRKVSQLRDIFYIECIK